jgi:hypothetical protein
VWGLGIGPPEGLLEAGCGPLGGQSRACMHTSRCEAGARRGVAKTMWGPFHLGQGVASKQDASGRSRARQPGCGPSGRGCAKYILLHVLAFESPLGLRTVEAGTRGKGCSRRARCWHRWNGWWNRIENNRIEDVLGRGFREAACPEATDPTVRPHCRNGGWAWVVCGRDAGRAY